MATQITMEERSALLARLGTCDISRLTLREAYMHLGGDPANAIPGIVRLFENPHSPLPMPGKVDLKRHDLLHILLDRANSAYDEAFVVGFSIGNDLRSTSFYLAFFKYVARLLYPATFRIERTHAVSLVFGYWLGKSIKVKNLHQFDFSPFMERPVRELREEVGLSLELLSAFQETEAFITQRI